MLCIYALAHLPLNKLCAVGRSADKGGAIDGQARRAGWIDCKHATVQVLQSMLVAICTCTRPA